VIFRTLKVVFLASKEIVPDYQVDTKEKSGLKRSLYISTTNLQHFLPKSKFNISSPFVRAGAFYDKCQETGVQKRINCHFQRFWE
jgi:hypothetical protein